MTNCCGLYAQLVGRVFLSISGPRSLDTLHTSSVFLPQTRLSEQGVLHQSTLLRHFEITINISTRIPLATTLCDAFLGVLHLDVSLLLYVHPFLTSMSGVTTFCAYTPSSQVLHVPRPTVRTSLPHKYDKCHDMFVVHTPLPHKCDKHHHLLYVHPFLTGTTSATTCCNYVHPFLTSTTSVTTCCT